MDGAGHAVSTALRNAANEQGALARFPVASRSAGDAAALSPPLSASTGLLRRSNYAVQ